MIRGLRFPPANSDQLRYGDEQMTRVRFSALLELFHMKENDDGRTYTACMRSAKHISFDVG